ncbi:MAG: MerR family DNA-binding transcriptional regulator, partial [Acidimicrobiia bacterium]|nr:MerR family DNA-binding transcriptional regulator [Acidimicrobiia bacterium]
MLLAPELSLATDSIPHAISRTPARDRTHLPPVGLDPVARYRPYALPVESLTIGALALAAGVNVETVRYYERRGLLDEPPRSPS